MPPRQKCFQTSKAKIMSGVSIATPFLPIKTSEVGRNKGVCQQQIEGLSGYIQPPGSFLLSRIEKDQADPFAPVWE